MASNPQPIKTSAQQDSSLTIAEALAARTSQYQDVMPEEILALLEEAKATYAFVAPALSRQLRNIARKEIAFFHSLYQNSLHKSLSSDGSC